MVMLVNVRLEAIDYAIIYAIDDAIHDVEYIYIYPVQVRKMIMLLIRYSV